MAIHKLRALEYLIAVVEHGSFAAAARRLGVAPPSVHRLVSALETELGIPLLDRGVAPLRPTRDAQGYVERARRLVAELQGLDAGLRDRAGMPTGTLALAAQSVAIEFVLADALARFHDRFPAVRIDLRDAGDARDLAQLGSDVLLQFGWPPPQEAIVRTLAHTRWLVVAAPSFWARHGLPQHPADLSRLPCALFRTPYGEVIRQWSFVRDGERVDVPVDGWLVGDNRRALDAPLLAGKLVARINDLTAAHALRDGGLQPVLLDWVGQHSPPLNLLIRRTLSRQPRVRAFIDFMAEEAERLTRSRLPAGLPQVPVATRPEWFRRRVG
jgi:LysR family transcriptional regulator for bpeEF and oprC